MTRGSLRIYLGAAPGVGKTYAMLSEGRRRRSRGTDVVIGFVEPHGRDNTVAQIGDLEIVAPRHVGDGLVIDVDGVLARKPDVVLVDELAHRNPQGSRNTSRWEDVEELLAGGIDVVTTLNVQHLASLRDVVEDIAGVRVTDSIPDEVVRSADQVELVDMTEQALGRRLVHGNIYRAEELDEDRLRVFRPGALAALREIALLWVADRVDDRVRSHHRDGGSDESSEVRERVVVAITAAPTAAVVIRRAARLAARSRAVLLGVHVGRPGQDATTDVSLLEEHRGLLEELGGTYHEVVSRDVADALVCFARNESATQLVLGATGRSRWAQLASGSIINDVIAAAGAFDVHVISEPTASGSVDAGTTAPRRLPTLSTRRRSYGWVIAVVGTGALTAALVPARGHIEQPSRFLLFQATVLLAAAVGGAGPAVAAALLATASLNWFFTPPLHTWTIDDPQNVLALVMFSVVGLLVAVLVNVLARLSSDSHQARSEAEALARVAGSLAGADDPLPVMAQRIRTTLGLNGVALYGPDHDSPLASSGSLDRGERVELPLVDASLVVSGELSSDDRRVLQAFAAQLSTALEHRRLRAEADAAAVMAEADSLRTALLRAVSHDLRTPLSSIKASVTSLLQGDVEWSGEERKEFLSTIDEETDRLDHVVADLLDASRLEAGVVRPDLRPTAIDDVVALALTAAGSQPVVVDVDVPHTTPMVPADLGLLERALVNLITNAAQVSAPGAGISIATAVSPEAVEVHVVDHGPGVPSADRDRMFEPFQRLDDTGSGGVGLGLAVARGLIEAMHGTLQAADTAGGGLTMIVSLPRAWDDH